MATLPLDTVPVGPTRRKGPFASVEREEWRSEGERKVATGHLKIVGTGATFDSTIALSPSGAGCVYEIDFTVMAKAPLIRKKLEAFIGQTALDSLKAQHEHYAGVLR